MAQNVTKMDDNLDEDLTNSATRISRLEQLVKKRCWESLAYKTRP